MISNLTNTRQHEASDRQHHGDMSKEGILQRSEIGFISMSSSCPQKTARNLPKRERAFSATPVYAPPVSTSFTNTEGTMQVSFRTTHDDLKEHLEYMYPRPRVNTNETIKERSFGESFSQSDNSRTTRSLSPIQRNDDDTDSYIEDEDCCEEEERNEHQHKVSRQVTFTRNFYTLFLLGVGLASLLLVLAGFLLPATSEDVYHNSANGKDMVVRNQDTKLTFYVLALALMVVLLGGSACYFYSNWLESQEKGGGRGRKRQVEMSIVSRWGNTAVVVLADKEDPVLPQ